MTPNMLSAYIRDLIRVWPRLKGAALVRHDGRRPIRVTTVMFPNGDVATISKVK